MMSTKQQIISKLHYSLSLLLFCISVWSAQAQMEFEAKVSKSQLGINERLRIDFVMNQDGDNFTPPDFETFQIVGGPSQQVSQQWINGKKSFSKIYSYFLQPTKRGRFTIKQASIQYDGQTYKTTPVEIEVTAAVEIPKDPNDPDYIASQNIHLVAEVSNTSPYLNEPILITYKLYVSNYTNVSDYSVIDVPDYKDFWNQKLERKQGIQNTTYKGQDYRYAIIHEVILYPQKTGNIEINPMSVEVLTGVRTNKKDFFGNFVYRNIKKVFSSNAQVINVKPLPEAGKPADFAGAVGDFSLEVVLTKDRLKATESTQAKVTISGSGNLKLFNLPSLEFPNGIEVYEPEHTENINTTSRGMQGSISDTYTLVPSRQGKYPINGVSFSYFDPKRKSYKSLTSEDLLIEASEAPGGAVASLPTNATNVSKQAVSMLGNQLRYLKLSSNFVNINNKAFFQSPTFYTLLMSPLLIIPIIVFVSRKHRERAADEVGNRQRSANRLAKKYLSVAKKEIDKSEVFYEVLERALHNYLKAKLHIETSEFSKDKIQQLLLERKVDAVTTSDFVNLLQSCELARYTPISEGATKHDYEKSAAVISLLDKQL
jgi:hypothetical protein